MKYGASTYFDNNKKELDDDTILEWLEDLCLNNNPKDPDCVKILAKYENKEKKEEMNNLIKEIFSKPLTKVSIKSLRKEIKIKEQLRKTLQVVGKKQINEKKNKDLSYNLKSFLDDVSNNIFILKNALTEKLSITSKKRAV